MKPYHASKEADSILWLDDGDHQECFVDDKMGVDETGDAAPERHHTVALEMRCGADVL